MSGGRGFWRGSGLVSRFRESRAERREEPSDGRNGLAMALSGVIAVFLWFFFSMNATYTIDVEVPLEYSLPRNQALSARPPAQARVTVQGDGWSLIPLVRTPQVVQTRVTSATVDVLTAIRDSRQLSDVVIQGASPDNVTLQLEGRETRLLPIRLVRQFTMVPSYDLLRPPRLSPDSVMVSGAASVIENLLDWPTVPFIRESVRDSFSHVVALSDTLEGLIVNKSPQATLVSVAVAPFTQGERVLDIEVRNLPAGIAGVRTEPARIRATYTVPAQQRADELARTAEDFIAVVDYADIARDSLAETVPVSVQIPSGLDIRNVALEVQRVAYFVVLDTPSAPQGGE
ncbi:MAG: hypothetical protein Rubg2KO_09970 [Rubricoccaceae bacterium]